MFFAGDTIESNINDLKAVVIGIFRTLLQVVFSTEKLLAQDESRKSVRQHIIVEADTILTSRIKTFFSDSHVREGYYLTYKLLALQPQVDKKRKAAEYWYYLFEMVPASDITEDEAYTHADIDEWSIFFCSLGDLLRDDGNAIGKGESDNDSHGNAVHLHAAAVKYYATGISLLRSMIARRSATLPSTNSSTVTLPSKSNEMAVATESKIRMGKLQLGSALLGTVLCSEVPRDKFFTLESKQQLEQTKLTYLNESLEIFGNNDWHTHSISKKSKRKYETDHKLASRTFEKLMASLPSSSSGEEVAAPAKKIFKRKKKKLKDYDMIHPFV